jgi:riboflavin biosynthesis pyrimidine reductase
VLRRLLPSAAELPLDDLYAGLTLRDPGPGTGWVALCMVSSADGAVSVDGRSGGLGGRADLLALARLRAANDVSLVGARTVREEGYGPPTGDEQRRADRARRGLRPAPRLAIVSGSGRLDPDHRVLGDADEPPLLLVPRTADRAALAALEGRAEIHVLDTDELRADLIVDALVQRGLRRILCEGGPQLNQAMLAADLVDEVFLTLAPTLVGGAASRIVAGSEEHVRDLALVSAFEHAGDLLLRYRHARHARHARHGDDGDAGGADHAAAR